MDILIPIGLGFHINLIVFIAAKICKQTDEKSLYICLIAFVVALLTSFFNEAWLGMGIGVISLGMLLFVIVTRVIISLGNRKNTFTK
ncbi:hypothetical protein [Alkalihalobacterium chitinilyticum]|uniref:Uncharacterized protein n=1 Tax=Alkalihalobacterium chitinilyticum TaxID=2980103 RepID=A0ABT5VHY2_9BACI|nr:hypothetical protein [Alkalihalobacterium chitinilyticum]MDE5414357.1 hypothetical protein [Alkalihalobacterium chitinilyticum]